MVRSLSSTSSKTLDKGRTRGLARVAVPVPSYKETRNKHKLSSNFYFCDNHKLVDSRLLCLSHHGCRIKIFHEYWSVPTVWGIIGNGGQNVGFVIWVKSRTRKKNSGKNWRIFSTRSRLAVFGCNSKRKACPALLHTSTEYVVSKDVKSSEDVIKSYHSHVAQCDTMQKLLSNKYTKTGTAWPRNIPNFTGTVNTKRL